MFNHVYLGKRYPSIMQCRNFIKMSYLCTTYYNTCNTMHTRHTQQQYPAMHAPGWLHCSLIALSTRRPFINSIPHSLASFFLSQHALHRQLKKPVFFDACYPWHTEIGKRKNEIRREFRYNDVGISQTGVHDIPGIEG